MEYYLLDREVDREGPITWAQVLLNRLIESPKAPCPKTSSRIFLPILINNWLETKQRSSSCPEVSHNPERHSSNMQMRKRLNPYLSKKIYKYALTWQMHLRMLGILWTPRCSLSCASGTHVDEAQLELGGCIHGFFHNPLSVGIHEGLSGSKQLCQGIRREVMGKNE